MVKYIASPVVSRMSVQRLVEEILFVKFSSQDAPQQQMHGERLTKAVVELMTESEDRMQKQIDGVREELSPIIAELAKSRQNEKIYEDDAAGHVHNIKNMDKCIRRKKRRIEKQAAEIERLNMLVLAQGTSARSPNPTGMVFFTVVIIMAMALQVYLGHPFLIGVPGFEYSDPSPTN